jgi:hypothetical protein
MAAKKRTPSKGSQNNPQNSKQHPTIDRKNDVNEKTLENRIQTLENTVESQKQQNSLTDKEINAIVDVVVSRVLECVKLDFQDSSHKSDIINNAEKSNSDVIFFRSKQGKTLQEEVNDESEAVFKVFNIKNNEANFKYCGGVKNPDYFGDECNFENRPYEINYTNIKTTTPGVVKKDNNGNWEVTTPAKIKFL